MIKIMILKKKNIIINNIIRIINEVNIRIVNYTKYSL